MERCWITSNRDYLVELSIMYLDGMILVEKELSHLNCQIALPSAKGDISQGPIGERVAGKFNNCVIVVRPQTYGSFRWLEQTSEFGVDCGDIARVALSMNWLWFLLGFLL